LTSDQGAPSLVGTWRLVSFVKTDGQGGVRQYWDEQATGLIVYTADGHVSAQLYDGRRPALGKEWARVEPDAAKTSFVGLVTYYGRYSVDPEKSTVTHTVEGAMSPDWVGTRLVRSYRFLGPNRIELGVLTTAEGRSVTNGTILVWERVAL
jgi:hypothetical protein